MPTKTLPSAPSLEHLKAQAKDLQSAQRAQTLEACQRIREFHPHFRQSTDAQIGAASFKLSDAQLAIAREYGYMSWPRLKARVENPATQDCLLPAHERIRGTSFRRAVDLLDAGNAEGLHAYLRAHSQLAREHQMFEGGNYFANPTLLEFIAENPTRRGRLPKNIVAIAQVILDAGAKSDRASVNSALGLVASSNVARECGVQLALIDLLCEYGADPNAGIHDPLLYGEFNAVNALLARGATMTLEIAAALGRADDALGCLPGSNDESRLLSLALAAQYGHAESVELLLDAGVDPDRYSPPGSHSHSTPLHQAALAGHERVVRLLVEHGARLDIKDIFFGATPLGWADHAGHDAIVHYLRPSEALKAAD